MINVIIDTAKPYMFKRETMFIGFRYCNSSYTRNDISYKKVVSHDPLFHTKVLHRLRPALHWIGSNATSSFSNKIL
jgi:hypothetical protein